MKRVASPNTSRLHTAQNRAALMLLLLPLVALALTFVWPAAEAVRMSLRDYTHNLYAPAWAGLHNYQQVLASADFQQAMRNSLFLLLLVMPGVVLISTIMALAFAGQYPGVMLSRTLVYLPVVVSVVVSGMMWKWLLASDGLGNAWLQQLGLPAIPWLTSVEWAMPAVALVIIWKAAAYYMMMLITRLESIPAVLYEAARLDGASPWQQFWGITFPQLQGMLGLVVTICTLGALKVFGEIYVLTGGGPLGATRTLILFIYERAFQRLDLGIGAAAGVLFALLIVCITLLQKTLERRFSHHALTEKERAL
jgi:putative chitobiose transport system permease protein